MGKEGEGRELSFEDFLLTQFEYSNDAYFASTEFTRDFWNCKLYLKLYFFSFFALRLSRLLDPCSLITYLFLRNMSSHENIYPKANQNYCKSFQIWINHQFTSIGKLLLSSSSKKAPLFLLLFPLLMKNSHYDNDNPRREPGLTK